MGLAPTALSRVPSIPPVCTGGPFLEPQPFPPNPPSPSSPHPLGSFCNAPGGWPGLAWGRGSKALGGWRGRSLQAALWARPTPKGPRHTKNSMHSEFTICSEFTMCSDSLHLVLIHYILSSESLCVVNSLQINNFTTERDSVLKIVWERPLGIWEHPKKRICVWAARRRYWCNSACC